jgi:integrase
MQTGYIYKNGNWWTLRYYEVETNGAGELVRKQRTHKLARIGDQYPNKTSVQNQAEEFLDPINKRARHGQASNSQRVTEYLEHVYLPHVKQSKKPSTYKCYGDMFNLVEPHLGDVTMFDFLPPSAKRVLLAVATEKERAHTTHHNVKSFLSGAFRYALQEGIVSNGNPMRDVSVAGGKKGKPASERPAYTLEETAAMLGVLSEPARTVVLTAALTGLRLSELKGLRWEDFVGEQVLVQRAVWNGKVGETKTAKSKAPVPVVPFLTNALAEHRARNSGKGYVFHGETGQPVRLENLYRRDMAPAFAKAKINWRGWHPFRYGVGTLLHSLGTPDLIIQGILRHANVSTTLAFYVKPPAEEARKAMRKLGTALGKELGRRAEVSANLERRSA